MLCPSCHTQNRDTARFCKGCGLPINDEQPVQVNPALPEQQPGTINDAAQTQQANQSTNSASLQTSTATELGTNGAEDQANLDITQVPTQLLTQQQMLAYHKRRWEQDLEWEQQVAKIPQETLAQDSTEQPTIQNTPAIPDTPLQEQAAYQHRQQDVADFPTIIIKPIPPDSAATQQATATSDPSSANNATIQTSEDANAQPQSIASSPATPDLSAPNTATDETVKSAGQAAPLVEKQDEAMEQTPPAQEQAASTNAFPMLDTGTTVNGRYEISQVLSTNEHEHTYQVTDHQGYQRCWNCNSEQNSEGDDFCIDCGANLHDAQYIMHEYPASASAISEANVLSGVIAATFIEQDRTYVIEQPQAVQIAFPNGVHLLAASDSDAGDVRRSEPNEDSTLVLQFERIHESQSVPAGIFVVADGMGGHDNGQVASHMTISQIAERITHELLMAPLSAENTNEQLPEHDEEHLVAMVHGAIEDANTVLCQANQRDKTDMGSTLTGFMMVGDHAFIFNVGDSRTYMLRDGNLYQLTTDHSLVGQLVAGGLIEPDEVYTHPQRNQIFRSIGDKLNVQIDIFKQQVHPGDILLSCSDGLWEMVRNPQITDLLNNAPDPQNACTQLIEAANTNGGEDNISAVVVYVR